jgi:hypothetical protein
MKHISLAISIAVTIALTIVSGILAGQLTGRWGASEAQEIAAERLKAFPDRIGDWQLRESKELSELAMSFLKCRSYVNDTFVHRQTGTVLTVSLLAGPFGPMSVHNPDVCFPYFGYVPMKKTQRSRIAAVPREGSVEPADAPQQPPQDEFWSAAFKPKEGFADPIYVYYAYSDGGPWEAPSIARFAFGGAPVLYRLNVSSQCESWPKTKDVDPCVDFIQQLLPIWREKLSWKQ